jgi:hypothetical protein
VVAVLASVPSNVEGGSYMTFGGPVGLFVVVAAILWLLFSRPHRRVPPRRAVVTSQAGAGTVSTASAVAVEPEGAIRETTTTSGSSNVSDGAAGDDGPDASAEGTEASE